MAAFLNKNTICRMRMLTPFFIKINLRENRFFAARRTIGSKKGTHNVKYLAEKFTTIEGLTSG